MSRALASAGIAATEVGYVNVHGTATRSNDVAEGQAIAAVLGADVPCSGTKGATGHLLGAAGITEAIVALLALARGVLPGTANTHHARRRGRLPRAARQRTARRAVRAQQLVRLRRQQLRAGVREPRLIAACIDGIGVLGPGLAGWPAARAILAGDAAYAAGEMPRPAIDLLPPAERRRCGDAARLVIAVGVEALAPSATRAADVPSVFTSSSGSGEVVHQICESLASPDHDVSPTRFHNSVHNAPAGYWSIATGARGPSTSLCAHESSFAAGLIEAAVQARAEGSRVLLVAYDLPHPFPLSAVAPVSAPFGVALLLAPHASSATLARLSIDFASATAETPVEDAALEALRKGNSAARALPILWAVARGTTTRVAIGHLDRILSVAVAA